MAGYKTELQALTDLCGNNIRYVDLVEVTFLSRSKNVYLAVGSHAIFLVRRDWTRVITGGELLYSAISRVAADEAHAMRLLLFLNADEVKKAPGAVWLPIASTGEPLCVKTVDRELLLRWLEVAWTCDFSLRTGRISPFPLCRALKLNKDRTDENPQDDELLKTSCPINIFPFISTQKVEIDGYFCFLRNTFQDRSGGQQSGIFLDDRGMEVQVMVSPAIPILYLEEIGRENIRTVASTWKKALLESAFHSQLLRSQTYVKKMNLSDDPASWTGWQLWLKTSTHNIICILLRRLYMPPLMDMSQDFTVLYKISFTDQKDCKLRDEDFMAEAQATADTFSPISQTSAWTKELLQAKLDALIFQPHHYRWFKQHLKMAPKWLPQAKVLVKSVLLLMHNDGVLADTELLEMVGNGVQTVDDPMDVIRAIIRSGEGLPTLEIEKKLQYVAESLAASALREEQKRRDEELQQQAALSAAAALARQQQQQQQLEGGGGVEEEAAAAGAGGVRVLADTASVSTGRGGEGGGGSSSNRGLSVTSGTTTASQGRTPSSSAAAAAAAALTQKTRENDEEEEERAILEAGLDVSEVEAFHRWSMRVGRYLAYCVDGGVLGYRFALPDISEAIALVTPTTRAKLLEVLAFLLHLRPRNLLLPWSPESLRNARTMLGRHEYIFNDRVFIPLTECGFIAKLFPKGEEAAYLELLRILLQGSTSHALKLTLCRQILKASADKRDVEQALQTQQHRSVLLQTLVPALINILHDRGGSTVGSSVTLQNICLGALINLSAGDPRVKEMLLEANIYQALTFIFQMKEDTLQLPCALLCLNLTKTAQHRQSLIAAGGVNLLVDILMSQYTSVFYGRQKLLGVVAAVLGQLAVEPQTCRDLITKYPVLDCLLYLFHVAGTSGDMEFRSRMLFSVKQLCQGDWQVQQRVGKHCIRTLVKDIRENAMHADYCTSVLLLLQVLADFKPNCFDMKAANIQEALEYLLKHTKLDSLYSRVANLQERVIRQTRYDYFST